MFMDWQKYFLTLGLLCIVTQAGEHAIGGLEPVMISAHHDRKLKPNQVTNLDFYYISSAAPFVPRPQILQT